MLGKSLPSPLLTFDHFTHHSLPTLTKGPPTTTKFGRDEFSPTRWKVRSTAETVNITSSNNKSTESLAACKQALSAFSFNTEEQDKILGKAFGQIHSPYWGEERTLEIPELETVNQILEYLKSLGLSDGEVTKLLKKFPEVLGCSLENELKKNVQILKKDWGIEGKSLCKLLLRNPRVLGFTVDCKGDCVALCTRCWARF